MLTGSSLNEPSRRKYQSHTPRSIGQDSGCSANPGLMDGTRGQLPCEPATRSGARAGRFPQEEAAALPSLMGLATLGPIPGFCTFR